ncbi:MAG: putative phosphohistidine phosphatase, SixA [Streptosporangiaceae bacterium]|jgi:phosphohistidine phosphatase|nr:putative phosphohistidine phosphatase, SixA [Streptosporangiaceae bacterium]
MPTLIVLRHAKAATEFGLADIDRPLTGRGRRDATAAGKWLSASGLRPDAVRCSPARRTRETLDRLELDAEVGFERGIYDNEVRPLLDLLGSTDDQVGTLLLIGHNPSLHQLVHDLTGDGGASFPTCAVAVIDFDGDWAGIRPGIGRHTADWSPRPSV